MNTVRWARRFCGWCIQAITAISRQNVGGIERKAVFDQVAADLENLNRATERDFLAVGEKLMAFRSAARQISAETTALTELISGELGMRTSRALSRTLDHAREIDARIGQHSQELARVSEISREVSRAFSALPGRVMVFRTLCTLTRMETARLGTDGDGLSQLSEEVRPLSESIGARGQTVMNACSQLDSNIQGALDFWARLRARQLTQLHAWIGSVGNGLESFEARRQLAHEAFLQQADQYQEVCGAIEGVVQSIQFHDITRQQVEHVVDALRELREERQNSRGARVVLSVQVSQLSSAAELFSASVERMEQDLDRIASRVREMADSNRSLMGIDEGDGNPFFLQMEQNCAEILTSAAKCSTEAGETLQTTAGLDDIIGHMRDSVGDIRGTEWQLQRIAINATIRAAHLGDAGNALNIIAESMGHMDRDSIRDTEIAADAFRSMEEAIRRAFDKPDQAGLDAKTQQLLDELRTAVSELHASSETSCHRVKQIAALGTDLGREIQAVRAGFSAGRLFAQTMQSARDQLRRIAPETEPVPQDDSDLAASLDLERLSERYTMQAEREVHENLVHGSGFAAPEPANLTAVACDGGDLGDNVELF